ncbi:MAG: hypothetical protein GY708_05750 [Actinomycetia bacterium]|nr:hypothetical protein [Actinomycetes bacterium]
MLAAIVGIIVAPAATALGMPLVFAIVFVNFVGGHIPHLCTFVGEPFAMLIALSGGGLVRARGSDVAVG